MPCCSIEQFVTEFAEYWSRAKHSPSTVLIDWERARRDWKRYHCTAAEAVSMQVRDLLSEADYIWLSGYGGNGGNGDDRGPDGPNTPTPSPSRLQPIA
jgi:hypothetical protein